MTKEFRAAKCKGLNTDKNSEKRELTTLNISTIGKETFASASCEKGNLNNFKQFKNKVVSDNRKFWQTQVPYFQRKRFVKKQ